MVPLCGICFINVTLVMSGNSCPVFIAVSYTHLDVYKRQALYMCVLSVQMYCEFMVYCIRQYMFITLNQISRMFLENLGASSI